MNASRSMAGLLALAVVASALAVVYGQHRAREAFVELQRIEREQAALNTEWGRLQLERGTWAAQARIERLARARLNMRGPDFERARTVVLP